MDARKVPEAYRRVLSSPHGEILMHDLLERYVVRSPSNLNAVEAIAKRDLVIEIYEIAHINPMPHTIKLLEEVNG